MKPQFEALFQPLTFNNGATLPNRLVLAPMTHWASHEDGTASEAEIDFVASRSKGLGMVITAATTVHPTGRAFDGEPNAIRAEDLPGLRRLAQSIQAKGAKAVLQIHHGGFRALPHLVPANGVVAPSAFTLIPPSFSFDIEADKRLQSEARVLTDAEIRELVAAFAQATQYAVDAGFDGVEIHSANGYLINQFISAHSNQRDDEYGSSLQNRLRFLREVTQAVAAVVGKDRLGVRFAPLFASTDEARVYLGLVEENPHETYVEAVKVLEEVGIAYLSLAEADWENAPELPESFRSAVREVFSGRILYAGKYTAERGKRVLEAGWGDLVAFGRPFIANPDLPKRIANGWPLNPVDPASMYGGTAVGYTDYPTYGG